MMIEVSRYSFSFTAAAMQYHDFMRLVDFVEQNSVILENEKLNHEQILQKGNEGTSKREMHELVKRYLTLTIEQRNLLSKSNPTLSRQVAFVAICKAYSFIYDFVIEVLRESYLVFDFNVDDGDFRTFVNRKVDLHPELENFAESTVKKARQVIFKMLEDGGLIDSVGNKTLQPQWLDEGLKKALIADNPELLKLFFFSDKDIKLAIQK